MRIFLSVLATIVAGMALGTTTAYFQVRPVWVVPAEQWMPAAPDVAPKVVVDHEEHDFGAMDAEQEGCHEFVFTNVGTAPMQLTPGATTCRCTVSVVDTAPIPPGGVANVKVVWNPHGTLGPYRKTVTVRSNDPHQPEITLTVVGEVTVGVRVDPPELVLSRIPFGESGGGEVRLWCNLTGAPLEITSLKLTDESSAKWFQATWEPLPPAVIEKEEGAKSGALLHIAVKPGLPQGPFQQTISLRTNQASRPELTVPIKGMVQSDISIAGPAWNSSSGVLDIGTVTSQTGAERRLLLVVHGKECKAVRFKPVRMVPAFLQARLGETTVIGDGEASHTPLFVQIPPGSPEANYLGSNEGKLGEILLQTSHPKVPELRILVRFAIGG
ncbi:MAG: DUF1573 domain-containing protein [Thermoguttaceae bacterium]